MIKDVSSLSAMKAAANEVAADLAAGAVLVLDGDLGAGKTQFTQFLGEALGCAEAITSPTFPLIQEYKAALPIYHFDFYRLNSADELYNIGYYDYLDAEGICIIEWGSKFTAEIPKNSTWIFIKKAAEKREMTIERK